ncbi:hypothetical protein psal_cds_62 [Pandoravirus salinus]|uniref:Uncharacterized protein n=1 Tax=Pandoravirus salinus TaxID=1349410 RepID=S4VZL5_9VIRU|nr:hypothetical protein psal_cds_62 [Pandoravirus salinus]AGO83462.2 hypothetical protein psal_cds_62 [Pandoravirus salinus]
MLSNEARTGKRKENAVGPDNQRCTLSTKIGLGRPERKAPEQQQQLRRRPDRHQATSAMHHGMIDIVMPLRPGRFPSSPVSVPKRSLWSRLVVPVAADMLLVALFWAIGAASPCPTALVAIGLTGLVLVAVCRDALCRQGEDRAVAALALNVDSAVRAYADGATPMFEIDEVVAHALSDPWYACGAAAARLDLYVMYSPPVKARDTIARAVYTRQQAQRIWPLLFNGPTARRDRRRLFDYTVRIPTTRRLGVSPVGDVCTVSIHTALHPVDAFAYALDAGVAAQMATDRLVQNRLEEQQQRWMERQRAIWREEEERDAKRQSETPHTTGTYEAQPVLQPPPLFAAPAMTH